MGEAGRSSDEGVYYTPLHPSFGHLLPLSGEGTNIVQSKLKCKRL